MQMGGILGSFLLNGEELADFWPYLWLGQWTHAGKGATMGLGRYRIVTASLPDTLSAA
jgi:CRISPR/Cas system endoribonuclease Cas6 (RAMP superfamily)